MGGTSFDIGMVAAGSPRFYQFMPIIDRWVVDATIVDCHSIGAGGGSIARVNELIANRVEVGPESAGSMPGPAAYNQGGTDPTVTDADVALGYVNPDNFHGGRIRLNRGRAERALRERIAEPLGVSVQEAALMVRRIVDANMGQAIRRETVLKGFDPREFILFAFGGAGPTHCCGYARFAEMDRIVVFPFAPTFCAFGSSTMDIVHVYERSRHLHLLHPTTGLYLDDYDAFNETVEALQEVARRDFSGEGYELARRHLRARARHEVRRSAQRQAGQLTAAADRHRSRRDRAAGERSSRSTATAYSPLGLNPEAGIEIHNFVIRGRVGTGAGPSSSAIPSWAPTPARPRWERRLAHWEEIGTVSTPVFDQDLIRCGNVIDGPAIIEAEDTTIVIEPGWRYTLDEYLNGVIEHQPAGADRQPARDHLRSRRGLEPLKEATHRCST